MPSLLLFANDRTISKIDVNGDKMVLEALSKDLIKSLNFFKIIVQ
ncbi:hypothetical protein [Thomasclavelia sp.]